MHTQRITKKFIEFSSGSQSSLTERVFGVKLEEFARTDEFNRGFHIIFFKKICFMKLESVRDDPAPKSFFVLCCLIAP